MNVTNVLQKFNTMGSLVIVLSEGRDDMSCATNDDPTYELLPPISYYEYDATITVTS